MVPRIWRYGKKMLHGKRLKSFGLTVLVTFLVGWVDILGLHNNLSAISERVTQRTLASTYRDTAGQKTVTVVLIDKNLYENTRHNPGWPLPTNFFLRRIIDPIVRANPAAIFIDISFTDMPRPLAIGGIPDAPKALTALADGLREASRNTPILVGDVVSPSLAAGKGCPTGWIDAATIDSQRTLSSIFVTRAFAAPDTASPLQKPQLEAVAVNWEGDGTTYPTAQLKLGPAETCNRGVPEAPPPRGEMASGYLATPAVALLASVCAHHTTLPTTNIEPLCGQIHRIAGPEANGLALYALGKNLQAPIMPRWGTHMSEKMQTLFSVSGDPDQCLAQAQNSKFYEVVIQAILAFMPGLAPNAGRRPCAYVDTISVADLTAPPHDGAGDIAADFLQGRIVLIGTNLPQVRDNILSPVNDQMPGVYLHATALENLLTSGLNYRQSSRSWRKVRENLFEAIIAALLSLVCSVAINWIITRYAARKALRPAGSCSLSWATRSASYIAGFFAIWILLALLVFGLAIGCSIVTGQIFGTIYYGSPVYIALAAIAVMTEEVREKYFGLHAG
jgi:CHASE2 domain-containing sensor protein